MNMKNFDWDSFGREEIVVHCKTEEEAIDFCNQSHRHNYDWCDGESREDKTEWFTYKEEIVYYTNSYATVGWVKRTNPNKKIIEWSDYMDKVFTKSDLKTGDIVLKRNGSVEIVILEISGGTLINQTGYNMLSYINEDLTSSLGDDCFDIMYVRRPVIMGDCQFVCFENGYGELVYDRIAIEREAKKNQVEEMTMEQICQALGKNIKIVKDKEN